MEEQHKTIVDTTAGAIIILQGNRICFANRALEKLTGYSRAELLKMNFWDYAHPDYKDRIREVGLRRQRGEVPPSKFEFKIITKNGAERWVESHPTFFEYEGRPAAFATIFDITERKEAERMVKESETRFFNIINFLPDATFSIDCDGMVTAWNREMEKLTGIQAESILGKGNYEYALPFNGERVPILIDFALNPEKHKRENYTILKKDNRTLAHEGHISQLGEGGVFVLATAAPLYDSEGRIVGAIESIRDVTEKKKAEDALILYKEELEKRVDERTIDYLTANEKLRLEIIERKKVAANLRKRERELKKKSDSLERVNTALNVLLKRGAEDRSQLEEKFLSNIKELVLPYIEKLKHTKLSSGQTDYVNILESHVADIASPFLKNLKSTYFHFTPRELEIASLVKEGKTTKEISEMLHCSCPTIDFHRFNIRGKLGLLHKKTNLRTILISFSSEEKKMLR